MSLTLIERIEKNEASKSSDPVALLPKVLATVLKSNLDAALDELSRSRSITINRDIVERGKKLVIDVQWLSDALSMQKRMVLSIREDRLAFIGDTISNQYLVLEGDNIGNIDLVEEYLAKTFTNPQLIPTHNQLQNILKL